jgi:AhpD family alkylhydroperoxidase
VTGTVMRTALRKSLAQIQYVHPVRPGAADGLVAEVYRQLEDEFGMIAPPVALHSPAPPVLAASWLMLRETLLAGGGLSRSTKEAVAAAVSVANTCPYCVEVHSTTMRSLGSRTDAEAIAADRAADIFDPALSRIATWARTSGYRDEATVPPVPAAQVPEVVGVATVFQYLNRMVHVFLGDSPMPPGTPDAAKGVAGWVLAKVMRPSASIGRTPGAALDLLPASAPAPGFEWASASPSIAQAFARAWRAVDDTPVPAPVRALVLDHLASWTGQPSGPSRAWATNAVAGLPSAQRPAGRLALLTAVAPYQVDAQVVADVQADDATLIGLTSWSALAAARHISTWIPRIAKAA